MDNKFKIGDKVIFINTALSTFGGLIGRITDIRIDRYSIETDDRHYWIYENDLKLVTNNKVGW